MAANLTADSPARWDDRASSPSISVITASRNAASTITRLYDSLAAQRYPNFEWIVADAVSSDGTVDLLREFAATSAWTRFVSEPDGGIYHAINKAIARAGGDYYVVAGADDLFDPNALSSYAECVAAGVDIVLARVHRAGRTIGGFHPRRAWIGPSWVFPGSHSVGMLIRKDLHLRFGQYSSRFPLLADVHFLKILLRSGTVRFVDADFVAGTFTEGGVTTVNQLQLLAENWQIQMLTEPFPLVQTMLYFGKVLRRYGVVSRELRTRRQRSAAEQRV
jgi:glycosyltransferase involved in cell wall biosynthesis